MGSKKESKLFGFDTDYKINKKSLYWLEPIIIQWLKIHRDYLEEYDFKDSLYWYNERANISALAGAVWKCSGFALEEYSSTKGSDDNKSSGRIDLYLSLCDNEAVVEAKLHWLYLQSSQDIDCSERISKTHENAKKDIKKTMAQQSVKQGLALTFILPHWNSDDNIDLSNVKKEILESDHDIAIWFHNKTGKNLKSEKGHIFNSVAIVANLA